MSLEAGIGGDEDTGRVAPDGLHLACMTGGKSCGTLVLREDEVGKEGQRSADKPRAALFFVAYTLNAPKGGKPRPATFSFNGGPGSSSV